MFLKPDKLVQRSQTEKADEQEFLLLCAVSTRWLWVSRVHNIGRQLLRLEFPLYNTDTFSYLPTFANRKASLPNMTIPHHKGTLPIRY